MNYPIEKNIKKPSAMIQTKVQELTLIQRKLINFLIFIAQQEGERRQYITDIQTLKKLCKVKSTENIDLKEQFSALEDITIEFNYLNKDRKNIWERMHLVSAARIGSNTGTVVFEIPYMLQEKILNPEIYAPLNVLLIAGLKSKYSIVLYELLRDYISSPVFPQIEIEKFRELLGLQKNQYKVFQDFKKRVLDRAVHEVNTKTDILCSYELWKESGNRYAYISFTVKKNPDFKLVKPKKFIKENNLHLFFDKTTLPKEVLEVLPEEYQINSIYHEIEPYFDDLDFLVSNIEYSNKHCDKNYPAYLKKTLENDYAKVNREVKEKKDKIVQEKKNQIQEEKKQEILLKQKAWDYFNSLPEDDQFKFRSEAEEKMSAPLKIFKASERKNDIINAQIEKDIIQHFEEKGNI
ncbi:RepB family plasmid replication initiator protein [bacterium]|nr:RepB family plasmid replication initiator protein [Bacteroidales bacterium]MCK5685135.1 RepB family plasmid replication initiator protein [bacterium]